MSRLTLLILIVVSLIAGSCSGRNSKLDKRNLIPEKELVSILTDVHIADGLLTLPKIHSWFSSLDSVSSYYYIIEKHGYSKETMDKTMKYYFIKKPKKLIEIYDEVLGKLSEMESLVERELTLSAKLMATLWTGNESYSFPDPAGVDSTQFDIPLMTPGDYSLKFTVTLFPDDQSLNPRMTAFTCRSDSINTGKRKYIETINYNKDGQPHTYTYIIKVPRNSFLHLRGWLYDFDSHPDEWEKHVIIKNISLTFIPAVV
jgi:hypothetical protein